MFLFGFFCGIAFALVVLFLAWVLIMAEPNDEDY